MTYQPPPPPPPGPPPQGPPGGPPGQWGPPGGQPARSGGSFDPKSVHQLDWGILGAGALAFIFSFVSYYTFSAGGYSFSENAWHGFFGWFAMLLAVAGSAAIALELFMPHVKLPFPNRLVALGAYALAVICVLLALLVVPGYLGYDVGNGVDEGHGFGYWISLIVIIAGAVLAFMRFQQTGGQLPIGGRRTGAAGVGGASGPGATQAGGYGPPAGGGYAPPASGGYGPPQGPPAGGGYVPPQGQQGPPPPPPSH